MIDAMNAVQIAKQHAAAVLGAAYPNLEEIERETHREQEVWSITLSFPRDVDSLPPIVRLSTNPVQYKRFLINAETGDLVAIKIRELATQ